MSIVAVVGPTASGKTSLAINLCKRWEAELVGVDASQVYRGMDIGTGKASASELDGIVHHMLDLVDPSEHFDAAAYTRHADTVLNDIRDRGKRAILCGGTGLYLQALTQGLCQAPPAEEEIRHAIQERLERGEIFELYEELTKVDPIAANKIKPTDGQRIERALGVFQSTGRPLSDWQKSHGFAEERYRVRAIGVAWPRAELRARIERRVDEMLETGWLDEVHRLREAGYSAQLRSFQALGYGFLSAHLDGEISLAEAREKTLFATWRYAKRQETWFRNRLETHWFDAPIDFDEVDDYVAEFWG